MTQKNQYGLSRDIPADVKRAVRQACGYGCVICGSAIIEYEHVEPTFSEAREHDARAITLLCPQCHAKVTRGFLSKQAVQGAMREPRCMDQGFANEFFDIGRTHPRLVFAGMTIEETQIPIQVSGEALFQVQQAEEKGGPFRLDGTFHNSRGELSLQIIENEWREMVANWDAEAVGGVITIRDDPRHVSLMLRAEPPDTLIVEQLDMFLSGYRFLGNPDQLTVVFPGGGRTSFTRCLASHCHVGLALG
jgi:hypothetical protein